MDNTYLYLAGTAASAALLVYLLNRREAWTVAAPIPGTPFSKLGPGVRLRDLFRLSVALEEIGHQNYLRMQRKAADPGVRELCAWLAEEEARHRGFSQGFLDKWRSLPPDGFEWAALLEKARQQGFFSDPPGEDATEDEMAAFAIAQEVKSVEFYSLFEEAFPGAWKRAKLRQLVEEERSHEARLRQAYPHVN